MTVKPQNHNPKKIVLGTRGSPLALAQAEIVRAKLAKIDPNVEVEVKVIKTSGDWSPQMGEICLAPDQGGKALFAKELEIELLAGGIDAAVHSMKDMESPQTEELIIPFILPREDARDVFLSKNSQKIMDMPTGSIIGTVSARRAAFLLAIRPDFKIVPLRGNVQTRIDKMNAGLVDATVLAAAGLNRLGIRYSSEVILEPEIMLPAAGQGAIGVQIRRRDRNILSIFDQLNDEKTNFCVSLEREVVFSLGSGCRTPIGVHARSINFGVILQVCVLAPDGQNRLSEECVVSAETQAKAIAEAKAIGENLRCIVPKNWLE